MLIMQMWLFTTFSCSYAHSQNLASGTTHTEYYTHKMKHFFKNLSNDATEGMAEVLVKGQLIISNWLGDDYLTFDQWKSTTTRVQVYQYVWWLFKFSLHCQFNRSLASANAQNKNTFPEDF